MSDLRIFKVSHQIINEKTVQVYCTLHCTLVFFMIAFEHSAQQCSENDLVTAESQLVVIATNRQNLLNDIFANSIDIRASPLQPLRSIVIMTGGVNTKY